MKKLALLLLSVTLLAGCTARKPADEGTTSQSQSSASSQVVSPAKAIKVTVPTIIRKFQQKYPQLGITEISLKRGGQAYYYEVTGVDDQVEIETTWTAKTGRLDRQKKERLDADEANGVERKAAEIETTGLKALAAISKAATAKVGAGTAIAWTLEKDHGETQWEVKVRDGRETHEVQVDAYTAKAVAIETDDD